MNICHLRLPTVRSWKGIYKRRTALGPVIYKFAYIGHLFLNFINVHDFEPEGFMRGIFSFTDFILLSCHITLGL
jgi:hypothetical protein